jgi:hypothetical protein
MSENVTSITSTTARVRNTIESLQWGTPSQEPETAAPTMVEIGAALRAQPRWWAIVQRPDRMARAEGVLKRIELGDQWGPGFEAAIRKVGGQIIVWARYMGDDAR